jgi:hypothetical protein
MKAAAIITAVGLFAACNVNPYALGVDGDGGAVVIDAAAGGDGGGVDTDAAPTADAAPDIDACLPSPEACDGIDNDCDTMVDEGFNLDEDPNNCGDCGNQCTYDFAFGLCNGGDCEQGACFPGYIDLNADPADGCEYFCIPTAGGVEQCDGVDNDCDGDKDEDFDVDDDVLNCGSCGNVCSLLHATPVCVGGMCEVDECDPGFVDVNPLVPGCELFCTPTGAESCNGADDDCDGMIDEGNPGGGAACGSSIGECSEGITTCSFGTLFCVGEVTDKAEICNNKDDDCDTFVDETFSPDTNPLACGPTCEVCSFLHAIPECTSGVCTQGDCTFGFHDIDAAPGCEYECIVTGPEVCDNVDNDCNGTVDDGFDLSDDIDNCGTCGNTCSYPHATPLCVAGGCVMGTCDANFYDIDLDPDTGCEYTCFDTGAETCDLTDNDCDGDIDEGDPGGGVACGTDEGECTFGTSACVGGNLVCNGGVEPVAESCDFLDNDCDGTVDDGFDKLSDPRFCGDCTPCDLPFAVEGCSGGVCTIAACEAGHVDFDGVATNGCELACTPTGAEVCDGIDNDCDTVTDEVTLPPSFCRTAGECTGATVICAGAEGIRCNYKELAAGGADIELETDGVTLKLEEVLCDNADGDCDGGTDEPFGLKGTSCAEDGTFGTTRKLGACRGTGTLICNGAMTGLACNITTAGASPGNESCDNKDNDCDGHLDEPWDFDGFTGVRDTTVGPLTINGQSVVMYRYEASRQDATSSSAGIVDGRACSVNGRLPWQNISYDEAEAACEAAGMRLCEVTRDGSDNVLTDEWGRFCEGSSDRVYPYGNSYSALTCNGSDFDPIPGGANEDFAVATGSLASCQSLDLSRDQSGNLKEWVTDPRLVAGIVVHTLRGGSFDNHSGGLTCDFDFTVATPDYRFPNVGFRCCARSCPAGQVDCGGTCRNLSTSSSNCGACGNSCGGGATCQNGYCCPTGTEICADACVPTGTCP